MSQTQPSTALPARRTRRRRDERGMSTVEYAVGTVAVAGFGSLLYKILTDPEIQRLLLELFMTVLRHFMKVG